MENITLSHTFLYSPDQEAAVDFYTRVLGLEVRTDVTMQELGMRWLTVGAPTQPGLEINLMSPDDEPKPPEVVEPKPPEVVETIKRLTTEGAIGTLIFTVDDCQVAFDRIRDAGAKVTQEPTKQPYGVIDCAFRDPNGNHVRFSQVL